MQNQTKKKNSFLLFLIFLFFGGVGYLFLSPFKTANSKKNLIYPQSYTAASYACDFLAPERIMGYPEGFPIARNLWSTSHLEKLIQKKTDLVLIAPYTNPHFIEALRLAKIPFEILKHPMALTDIPEQAFTFCQTVDNLRLGLNLALTLETLYSFCKKEKLPSIVLLQDYGRLNYLQDPLFSVFSSLQKGRFSFEKLFALNPDLIVILSLNRTEHEIINTYPVFKQFKKVSVIKAPLYHYPSFWNRQAVQDLKDLYETL